MYLVFRRPAGLCGEHLNAADSENGQYGDGEEHDAEPADPLRHGTPEKNAVRHFFDVIHNRGSRTGETGHGFKESVCHVGDVAADEVGQHAEQRKSHPRQTDDDITVAAVE